MKNVRVSLIFLISRNTFQIGTSPTDGDNAASWNSNTSNVEWPSERRGGEIFRSATRTSTILADFASIDLSIRAMRVRDK